MDRDQFRLVGGPHSFVFEVDPALLHRWGGESSPEFNRRLAAELWYRGLCWDSYRLDLPGSLAGSRYAVSGRCRDFAF